LKIYKYTCPKTANALKLAEGASLELINVRSSEWSTDHATEYRKVFCSLCCTCSQRM